jgi:hypothetical protein
MKAVWIYVDARKQVGDVNHLKVFASIDAANEWFKIYDPEGVATALMRSRASTGGEVSNVVAITNATAEFFMASFLHASKRAGGTNGCHQPCGPELRLILLKY